MTATVTTTPSYPVPGRQARIVINLSESLANYARVWCTRAPEGSELQLRIAKLAGASSSSTSGRVLVYEGPAGANAPWRHVFDKGGVYTLLVQEYTQGGGWGGGYELDTRGAPMETERGSEGTVSLYVAQRLTVELGFGDDRATLVLYVHNDTIVQTLVQIHGEKTPIITDWTSPKAATAAGAARNATNNLAGVTTANALAGNVVPGSIGAVVDAAIESFASHAENTTGTYHNTADQQDDLQTNYKGATSPGGLARAVNKLRRRLDLHMLNAKENAPSNPEYAIPGSVAIHDGGGAGPYFDLKNALLPIVADENDPASIYAAFGDFWRAYEAHRTASMHDTADNTNSLWTLEAIALVHKDFMTQIAALTPSAQLGQSSGAARLIGQGGFAEA